MKNIADTLDDLTSTLYETTDAFYEFKKAYLISRYKNKRSKRLNSLVRNYAWGLYIAFGMGGTFEQYLNRFKCSDTELTKFFLECNDTEWIDKIEI